MAFSPHDRTKLQNRIAQACCTLGVAALVASAPLQALAATSADLSAASRDAMASAQGAQAAAPQGLSAVGLRTAQAGERTYIVPVSMLKLSDDSPSMASPVLYEKAFVTALDDAAYRVTVYLVNATIMSSTIYATSLGEATYDKAGDGVMVPVDENAYDKKTQVRSVTMTLPSLDSPVKFHMDMFMDAVRLSFDGANRVESSEPPSFPEVESSLSEYPADAKHVIGGSAHDDANHMARFPNGNVVVAGSTSSTDGSFAGRTTEGAVPYLALCNGEGTVLSTSYLTGADKCAIYEVSALQDNSGYYACGYFRVAGDPAEDAFKGLAPDYAYDTYNAFVARYDAANQLKWIKALPTSGECQYDGVAATSDGGCIAVAEMLRSSDYKGAYSNEMDGLVSSVAVKYDKDGAEQWHLMIDAGSGSISDTDGAIAQLSDGSYLLGGRFTRATGVLEGLDSFGGTFDLYMLHVSPEGKIVDKRSYGGSATNEDLSSVVPTSDGGFAFCGVTSSTDGTFASAAVEGYNGYVAKCASDGTVQWVDAYRSSDDTEAVDVAEIDGGYVVIGNCAAADGDFAGLAKGQDDMFVATHAASGERTSMLTFGGSRNDSACAVVPLDAGAFMFLAESASSDVDMKGIARGEADAVLVVSNKQSGEDAQGELRAAMEESSAVTALIEALPEASAVTLGDEQQVKKARAAFDELSAEATLLVPSSAVAKLRAAEGALAQLKEQQRASSAQDAAKASEEKAKETAAPARDAVAPPAAQADSGAAPAAVGSTVKGVSVSSTLSADVKVTAASAVTLTRVSVKSGAKATVNTVKIGGKTYKVTAIAAGAFAGTKAKSIVLGKNVTKVGKGAFKNAKKLTGVTLGKNVKSVGAKPFAGCKKLRTITLKSSKLTKASCKALLKGSSITKVKLSGVSKKAAKNYKKWFASADKRVKVK